MNTKDVKTMLEYVLDQMRTCKSVEECHQVIQSAIDLCGAHNSEKLKEEFGILG